MRELAGRGGDPVRSDPIPLSQPVFGEEELDRLEEVVESGWVTTGERTEMFEERIADLVGVDHGVGLTNCSSALYLAYRALDLSGEVITSPNTFATTVSGIEMAGAEPVLADIRPDTLTLDPESVKEAIGPETEAIVPVHYAGQATDMDVFRDLAADHSLVLIEDAAHGLGGRFRGEPQGTLGDAGCYSFHPTKAITTAEGGMLVTDDPRIADRVRRLRLAGVSRGSRERGRSDDPDWYYEVRDVSGKFNMTDLSAALGLAQLDELSAFIDRRREIGDMYDEAIAGFPGIEPLAVRDRTEHARHLYPVRLDLETLETSREEVDRLLTAEGISTGVYYIPIHHHPAFEDVSRGDLPTTEAVVPRTLCLPIHPAMAESDVSDVVTAVEKVTTSL